MLNVVSNSKHNLEYDVIQHNASQLFSKVPPYVFNIVSNTKHKLEHDFDSALCVSTVFYGFVKVLNIAVTSKHNLKHELIQHHSFRLFRHFAFSSF